MGSTTNAQQQLAGFLNRQQKDNDLWEEVAFYEDLYLMR